MRINRWATKFGNYTPEQFASLKSDIEAQGLLDPIVLLNGALLDGRHRLQACEELGITPRFIEWEKLPKADRGDSPEGYVLAHNLEGRERSQSVKAIVISDPDVMRYYRRRAAERQGARTDLQEHGGHVTTMLKSREEAGALIGVSGPTVGRAMRIRKEAPEAVQDILDGKKTIGEVDREIRVKHNRGKSRKKLEERKEGRAKHQDDSREVAHWTEVIRHIVRA